MRTSLAILALMAALAPAEVIDRVTVSVGSQVVTESAIRRFAQLEAFLTGKPARLSPAERRETAGRLVEQTLIRREIELSRFQPISNAEVEAQVARIRKDLGLDDAALRARLAANSLSYEDLFEEARWQLTLFRFIEFRFRPGVQVSEQEIGVYYDGELVQELNRAGRPRPPLDTVRQDILNILTERKVQAALGQWLDQAAQQVRIRYREETFR